MSIPNEQYNEAILRLQLLSAYSQGESKIMSLSLFDPISAKCSHKKLFYLNPTVSCFYETEFEILAGLGGLFISYFFEIPSLCWPCMLSVENMYTVKKIDHNLKYVKTNLRFFGFYSRF